eukprot:4661986-Prymnesium_polylepis.2
MSRAGFADKSHLMRQIEKYADIYTSRVSNVSAPHAARTHVLGGSPAPRRHAARLAKTIARTTDPFDPQPRILTPPDSSSLISTTPHPASPRPRTTRGVDRRSTARTP